MRPLLVLLLAAVVAAGCDRAAPPATSPARLAATLSPSMMVKTYGGRLVIRRNSTATPIRQLGG